jgi:hypothetical protein
MKSVSNLSVTIKNSDKNVQDFIIQTILKKRPALAGKKINFINQKK